MSQSALIVGMVSIARALQTNLICIAVLPGDRPDAGLIFFKRINVHHPAENYRAEGSAGGIASFLCDDRSSQTELRMRPYHLFAAISRGRAEIHMLVPLRDAQRNARVELLFTHTLGSGVHHTNQFVIVAMFFIKQ